MKDAFGNITAGRLEVSLDDRHTAKEISELITDFNTMTSELHQLYENLEGQVADRTSDLLEANTELERQRSSLEKLSGKLAKEAQFKSDLLSMVNHELRTPLTSIIALSQASRYVSGAEQADECHAWEEVEKNSNILLEMINNMLDIARSDAGGIIVASEPIDLGDLVAGVKGTMMPLAQKYCVELSTHIASDVPLIMGDYEKMQRVLENLISNAIKFTPDGGKVHLSIELDTKSRDVCLRVSDNGIGIALKDQVRIFDRFVQVDSTSTRKYNGSGLGLAIVKEYSELQGYSVSVLSSIGEGSTFVIRVPAILTIGEE